MDSDRLKGVSHHSLTCNMPCMHKGHGTAAATEREAAPRSGSWLSTTAPHTPFHFREHTGVESSSFAFPLSNIGGSYKLRSRNKLYCNTRECAELWGLTRTECLLFFARSGYSSGDGLACRYIFFRRICANAGPAFTCCFFVVVRDRWKV